MLRSLKENGPKILTEAVGNIIPFADIAIAVYQLLQNTIAKEQALATVKWIRETGEQSLRIGPRDMLIRQVDDLLDMELYRKTSEINKSSMSGAPTSVIYNNKLIQWRYTHNDDIQLLEDSHKPGTFQPKLDTTELEFSVFDKWEVVAADQGMPGSEQPLLEPTSDAQGFKITLVQERLTPLVLQGVRRYSATHQLLGSGEQLPIEYESWSEAVQSILDITNIELTSKV